MTKVFDPGQGGEVDAVELDFNVTREEWNEYKLIDGGVVRVKTNVQRIFAVLNPDGTRRKQPDGSPALVVAHKSDVVARL